MQVHYQAPSVTCTDAHRSTEAGTDKERCAGVWVRVSMACCLLSRVSKGTEPLRSAQAGTQSLQRAGLTAWNEVIRVRHDITRVQVALRSLASRQRKKYGRQRGFASILGTCLPAYAYLLPCGLYVALLSSGQVGQSGSQGSQAAVQVTNLRG
ncbi:hypothetical protein GGR52DRAFT_89858 [Hypoxylon sp. FL1284]|nr:hypothetical protein GGR52DRAFT_89858 [Hypoxylon sp. FL1284]